MKAQESKGASAGRLPGAWQQRSWKLLAEWVRIGLRASDQKWFHEDQPCLYTGSEDTGPRGPWIVCPTPPPPLTFAKKVQAAHCPGAARLFSLAVLNMRKNPKNPLKGENRFLLVRLVFFEPIGNCFLLFYQSISNCCTSISSVVYSDL